MGNVYDGKRKISVQAEVDLPRLRSLHFTFHVLRLTPYCSPFTSHFSRLTPRQAQERQIAEHARLR